MITQQLIKIKTTLFAIDENIARSKGMFFLNPAYDVLKLIIDARLKKVEKLKTMRSFINEHLN